MNGVEKAAVLMLSMGEQSAAEVMKFMSPTEVQQLGRAMTSMGRVSQDDVNSVVSGFVGHAEGVTSVGVEAERFVKQVLQQALGDDKARSMMDRISTDNDTGGLDMLRWMDSAAIAEVLRLEHPQIIAIVLAYLDRDQAADVLGQLPRAIASDVLMRMSVLEGVQERALHELSDVLERTFSNNAGSKSAAAGGVKVAAEIVNNLDGSVGSELLEQIKAVDAALGEGIEELMFVFENLNELDARGFQTLMREISSEPLLLALKGASDELKEKIFSNMSQRAAALLREDLEAKGPVRLIEVEAAQKEILTVARRLMDSGDISYGSGGGDDFI
ncbi:MAG: flagellar motor switch protein FliG [Gammaproteobacteria bacterium]|nr:MAG: flagellar motor switch protein FliG [Gammaproteobacteria bacterium]